MDTDIVLLLYEIKVNIRKVEAGDRECLHVVEEDFYKLMELLKLFLISEQETYYGYFLMNMSFQASFSEETIAGIKLNEYPPVFVSNPLLLCKFTLKEILFIMCHEIEHVILNHPAEMLKSNPTCNPDIFARFNYAADASVNDRIIFDIAHRKLKYLSFPEGCIDSPTFAKTFDLKNVKNNESYLYYYNLIKDMNAPEPNFMVLPLENADKNDQGQDSSSSGGKDKSSTGSDDKKDGSGEGTEGTQESSSGEKGDKEKESDGSDGSEAENGDDTDNGVVTAKNCKNPQTHNWKSGMDPEATEELIREYVNASYEMMSHDARGNMPGHFISQINKLNEKPVIRWEKVLKKYVGTVTAGYRKTRTRLNRRQPERFDLSGKMEDKTLKIVVAIDTSGSVGDQEIARIFDEIFDIVSKKKFELTIIECDMTIHRVYRVKKREDVQTAVRGRGGTEFSPVIEFINNDKYYRDALLIYFTDGYGESEIPKPRTYRNMWVVLEDEKCLSLKEPYGIVLKM